MSSKDKENIVMVKDFLVRQGNDEGLFYEDLPKESKELVKLAATKLLLSPGKIVVHGFTGAGKTYLIEQLVSNINFFTSKLPNYRTPSFIHMDRFLWNSIGEEIGFIPLLSSLKSRNNCEEKDLVFVTDSMQVAIAMSQMPSPHSEIKIILETDSNAYFQLISGERLWRDWGIVNANDLHLSKTQLVTVLYKSLNAELSEVGKAISRKEITSIVTFFTSNCKDLVFDTGEFKGKIALPPGCWVPPLRTYIGWKLFEDENFLTPSGKFNMSKAVKKLYVEHSEAMKDLVSPKNLTPAFISTEGLEEITPSRLLSRSLSEFLDNFEMDKDHGKLAKQKELILSSPSSLKESLSKEVFGQDQAIQEVVEGMMIPAAGLHDKNKPLRSFLFLGPTGVGKTKLAITLAKSLSEDPFEVLRLDMSEYSQPHEVSKLFGSPPGYVGSGEGGVLTNALKYNPRTLVLLDEIEKAHPKVYEQFLQVLDAGRMTSGDGEVIDFTQSVIVMTSNLGVREMSKQYSGFTPLTEKEEYENRQKQADGIVKSAVEKWFTPEFINRLDHKILFKELSQDSTRHIVSKELEELSKRGNNRVRISTSQESDIVDWVLDRSSVSKYGAREIQRVISREIGTKIAKAILESSKEKSLELRLENGEIVVEGV